MVPTSILSLLDRVASGNANLDDCTQNEASFSILLTDRNTCLIGDRVEHWFVALFEPEIDAKKALKFDSSSSPTWLPNQDMKASLCHILSQYGSVSEKFAEQTTIIRRDPDAIALCIPCDSYLNVAGLLKQETAPPAIVMEDWQYQLDSLNLSDMRKTTDTHAKVRKVPTTSNTFVTENGILICIDEALQKWSRENSLRSSVLSSESVPTPWPWTESDEKATDLKEFPAWLFESSSHQAAPHSSDSIGNIHVSRKRTNRPITKRSQQLLIATCVVVACSIAAAGLWLQLSHKGTDVGSESSVGLRPDQALEGNDTASLTMNEITSDAELINTPQLVAPEESVSIESLLSELNPRSGQQFNMNTTPYGIINDVLADTQKLEQAATGVMELQQPTEIVNTTDAKDETQPDFDSDESTNRSIKMTSAIRRDTIVIRTKDYPKQFRLIASLQTNKKLVVEPDEPILLENNKANFKIGMEDEEPEILVEVTSKPGTKWQILTSVALRDASQGILIPMGAQDATRVGNRLLEYHQWLSQTIASLQNAKSNRSRNSRVDYLSEIKKFERQQREVEKTIERWKAVERLCRMFFDNHELSLNLERFSNP